MEDKDNEIRNDTKYGEFVSSYFDWILPEKQKENAKMLNKLTKKRKQK